MPPRKSTSRRKSRPSGPASHTSQPAAGPSTGRSTKIESFSRTAPIGPPPGIPDSITWDYQYPAAREPQILSPEEREQLVRELLQFSPLSLLNDISNHAHNTSHDIVDDVEAWARAEADQRSTRANADAFEREVDTGSHALQTLIDSHVDGTFDMFTAYALRNAFKVPEELELVLPWHEGVDFDRAQFVVEIGADLKGPDVKPNDPSNGEVVLAQRLEKLRSQVEYARMVDNRLAQAEAELDKRLEIAAHRRAEVGFVHDAVREAGLAPLPDRAADIASALQGLHGKIRPLETPAVTSTTRPMVADTGDDQGSWQAGRQAYSSWALGKALAAGAGRQASPGTASSGSPSAGSDHPSADRIEAVEREALGVGSMEDIEELAKVL